MIRPVTYGNTKWRKLALKTEATSLPLFPPVGLRHCVSATPGQTPASSVPFSSMTNASARRLPGSRQPAHRCSFTASLRPGGEPWWGQSVPNVLSVMKMRFYSSPVSDGGGLGAEPSERRLGRQTGWTCRELGGRATWLPPDHELAVKTRGRCEARSPPRLCGDRAPPRHPLRKAHFSYFLAAGPAQATETFVPSSLVLPPRCGLRTVHRGGERAPGLTPRLRLGGPPACPALSRVRQGRCVPGGLEGNGDS